MLANKKTALWVVRKAVFCCARLASLIFYIGSYNYLPFLSVVLFLQGLSPLRSRESKRSFLL